jgi:hypothetical protein
VRRTVKERKRDIERKGDRGRGRQRGRKIEVEGGREEGR